MKRERTTYGEAIRKSLLVRSKRRRFWLGEKLDHPDDMQDVAARRPKAVSDKNRSYVVPCSTDFRDAILELADRRGVNAGELARAVLLLLPGDAADFPDPGEPDAGDRETVILKSGANEGKNWRRKPRLQVRSVSGRDVAEIRRALALALALDRADVSMRLEDGNGPSASEQLNEIRSESKRLKAQIGALLFEPLPHGVRNRTEALHVLGFSPGARPNPEVVRTRYRALAGIHHPDASHGDHRRMSQINDAVRILRGKG
jgi:hypothetical protein